MKKKVLAALIAVMSCTGAFSVPVNSFAASAEKTASEQTSEKGSELQAYADEISDLMLRSRIAGYAFVRDDKVVITYSAYEDKIKTYIDEKGYDKSIFVYEAAENVAAEKESALKPVAEDINEYMRSNGISGFTYVQEVDGVEKIFISYDGFFDKIKAYVTGKGIDENIVVYQQSHDDVIVSAAVSGDINNDGTFNIAYVVAFQKWLLGDKGQNIADWKAADLCADDRLDVFDLTMMKKALLKEMNGSSELNDLEVREILFGYADAASGESKPMSEIRIAMKCKAFCPAGETLNVDVARLGFSDSQIYEGNSFLYKYFIRSGENWQNLNDERLIVNGKAGVYEKYYYDDDRQMFLVGKEYDDYSTYHHENAELDFQNYTAGSSGCIAFNFAAQFYDDNGNLPEQPQSEGCGQLLYYYVGENGVGISNTSAEDAEKAYQDKGSGDVTPPDTYTGRWHGRYISYGLYQALKANGSEKLPVSVTLGGRENEDFVYNGRTLKEYTNDTMGEDITRMENLLNSIYGGDQLKYGEEIYISGTPDGTKWTKEIYDLTIERYGEELLSKYIVDGEFLKEQLRTDLEELKNGYKAALDEAVEAFYTSRIEETIAALESQGIRSERIEGTHDIVMYVTAAEFDTVSIDNPSYFSVLNEPVTAF
ncbi:MAG: hypothetical protein BWZ04_00866 [Firmicutes bacterium ADurb.BinA205]|nr:MAG: hypothetical protein BWZ04_00866 [Firmicutes bacterium ADurb.BinA205]